MIESAVSRAPVIARWSQAGEVWARRLLTASGALLVLDSAATLQAGYTMTLSLLCLAIACVLGLPALIGRWRELPALVRALAVALLAVYVVATILAHPDTVAGSARAGAQREYVYLAYLALGLTSMLLVAAVCSGRSAESLAGAVAAAGALAGAYAVYQWFALRYHLPFASVNNTLDSNGITAGASQGVGLFGGQRVRGTFLEPHFLGAFLAASLPIEVWCAFRLRGPMRALMMLSVLLSGCALLLTDSVPAWGTATLASAAGGLLVLVGRGRVRGALVLGMATAALMLAVVPAIADPGMLAVLTGRPQSEITVTTSYRTHIWSLDLRAWQHRPVIGYGPGQSAVQTAYAFSAPARPTTLVSAQGVWASALLDSGVVGLCAWIYLFGAVLVTGAVSVIRQPTLLAGAAFAAAVAVSVDVATSGDRLDPRQWLVLGLLLAASRGARRAKSDESQQQPG